MGDAFQVEISGPVYTPGGTIPGPGAWAPQYPAWLAAPVVPALHGAWVDTAGASPAPGPAPDLVQPWPEPVTYLFPSVFWVPVVAAAPATPDLWTVITPAVMRALPTVQPDAWTGPIAPPVAPLGAAAFYPSSLEHRRAETPSFTWSGFTPAAPAVVTWGWLPSAPDQLARPRPGDAPSYTAPVFTPVAAAVTFFAAYGPEWLLHTRPSVSDPSYFSAFVQPTGGGDLFRRTIQQRSGVRTIPTKM